MSIEGILGHLRVDRAWCLRVDRAWRVRVDLVLLRVETLS